MENNLVVEVKLTQTEIFQNLLILLEDLLAHPELSSAVREQYLVEMTQLLKDAQEAGEVEC